MTCEMRPLPAGRGFHDSAGRGDAIAREPSRRLARGFGYICGDSRRRRNSLKNRAISGCVVAFEQGREFLVCFGLHGLKFVLARFEFIPFRCFLEKHVQFEHFFEQFRRNIFRSLLADIESFLRSKYSAR